jgi:predicted dehydrogenase
MHRILIIGTGSIGERHVRCYGATGRATVGICEPNPGLRDAVGDRYGIVERFSGVPEALVRGWDAAVIATPATTHIPIARQVAERGIHLLIEKPLAIDVEGVAELIDAARGRGLIAGVAYVYRAHPGATALREALLAGRIGNPVQMTLVTGQNFPFYRPAYRQIYYARRDAGGGAVQDALSHFLNLGEWLLGPITRLTADAAHQVLDGVDVEDTVHVLARHGGVMASYSLNQHQAPNETTLTLNGTGGTLRWELHEQRVRWMTDPAGTWAMQALPPMERDAWFTRQCTSFLDAIEGKSPPLCNVEEGLQTLRATLAVLNHVDDVDALRPIR